MAWELKVNLRYNTLFVITRYVLIYLPQTFRYKIQNFFPVYFIKNGFYAEASNKAIINDFMGRP